MLEIRRKGRFNFEHTATGYNVSYAANDITIIYVGNIVKLRSVSGRVIFDREGWDVSNVRVYDDYTGGGAEVFANTALLADRLIELEYPYQSVNYLAGAEPIPIITSTIETFTAIQNQTEITLTTAPDNVDVYVNERLQFENIRFSIIGNVITFTDPLDSNDIIRVRKF